MSDVNTVTIARSLLEALIEQHITKHGHTNEIARAAQLSLDRPAPVQVPSGWKLVPVEPTQDQRVSMRCVKAMTDDETRAMYAAAINVPAYAAAPDAIEERDEALERD